MIFEGFVRAESYDSSIESPGVASAISLHFGISSIMSRSAAQGVMGRGGVASRSWADKVSVVHRSTPPGADQVFP
jgi:hypothetical protein